MFQSILDSLFGCSHPRTTFPITPMHKKAGLSAPADTRTGAYVVCLDCGKEFAYDWESMRIGRPVGMPMATVYR
jgi:hypothetical protein